MISGARLSRFLASFHPSSVEVEVEEEEGAGEGETATDDVGFRFPLMYNMWWLLGQQQGEH